MIKLYNKNKKLYISLFIIAIVALVFSTLLSISLGSVHYSFGEVLSGLFTNADLKASSILRLTRLPRVLVALLIGGNLAMAGANMQAVMKNPLADPGIIGISSGSAIVAIFIMLVAPKYTYLVPLAAFIGGMLTAMLVLSMAWKGGADPVRIILSGVAVNAVLGGGVSLLSILYSDRIQGVMLWTSGSMSGVTMSDLSSLSIFSAVGLIFALLCIPLSNALLLGDDIAKNLGINTNIARILLCASSAYLTGISVSTVGLIGFIGLIIPHVSRLLVGSDYKKLIPFSCILGATLLVLADCIARTAFSPIEIPVGVVMAVLGGPFFVYLLRKKRRV